MRRAGVLAREGESEKEKERVKAKAWTTGESERGRESRMLSAGIDVFSIDIYGAGMLARVLTTC
jgi:hypothetical protein